MAYTSQTLPHTSYIYKERYSSVSELIQACDKAWQEGRRSKTFLDRIDFVGRNFHSWEEVKTASQEPWMEGLDIVQAMIYELDREGHNLPQPKDRKRRKVFSNDSGDDLDYDRLRNGQEEYWVRTQRQEVTAPQFISLICNVGANCTTRSKDILWRGAAAIVLADALEKNGFRVELHATHLSKGVFKYHPNNYSYRSICAKEAQSPLDIASIVTVLSGWFFRSIFGFQGEHIPPHLTVDTPGYGYSQNIMEYCPCVQEICTGAKPIIIDGVWSLEAAKQKVRSVILSLGENS